ncbi:hypothetical protein [Paenibacillus sp. MER 99-2]|uniref:hypothetical protein n=1 Tax=Paenibacillus sp. MER 99-2 TaxID=2939572 RepID=UPI0020412B2F|nr:hypothetical protein [Paenibacillus sp. MER 99-2]MCM3174566.1 hypothetical protein [Paenibacillus sp. MER 99-2]
MEKDQDLKKLFGDPRIPDVELTGKVMKVLHTEMKKERFFVKYKIALTAFVGMMLMATTGYAAVQYHSLTNTDGEVVYETKSTKEYVKTESKDDVKRFEAFYDLKEKQLKNGQAALFYVAANNPNHQTDLGTKATSFYNLSQLQDKITDQSIKVADKVNGDYAYQQADVFFKTAYDVNPPSLQEKEEMTTKLRDQAEKSKQGYAMMPVEMTDEVAHLSVTYQNGEDKIEVMINNLTGKSDPTSYIDEKVEFKQEKLQVKGVEMLQTEFTPSRAIELQWIYESPDKKQRYSYTVRANSDHISKETLTKIAESYLDY